MQALIRTALLASVVAACNHAASSSPDATVGPDASTATGLVVSWLTSPIIPGDAGNSITVTGATFELDDVRVIGDAGPGDPRTSQTEFTITWAAGMPPPPDITFADAPTGLYSDVALDADGHLIDDSYSITGNVVIAGVSHAFKVHDRDILDVTMSTSAMLDPGGQVRLPISIALDQALGVVDFTSLDTDNGVLDLDTFDPQMSAFRSKLMDSFAVSNVTD